MRANMPCPFYHIYSGFSLHILDFMFSDEVRRQKVPNSMRMKHICAYGNLNKLNDFTIFWRMKANLRPMEQSSIIPSPKV